MKLSKLLATSLALLSALAVGMTTAEARNPAKNPFNGITLGTTYVFPTACGNDPLTQANFTSTTGFPLTATVNEATTLTGGYAGSLIFTPVAGLDITNLSTFTSPLPQGTLSQVISLIPAAYTSTNPGFEQAIAYSWLDSENTTRYGISFVPTSFVTGSTAFTNHAIKGKSFQTTLVTDTVLTDYYNNGFLINLIGNNPGVNSTNFQLLAIGSALVNLDVDGTNVTGNFNAFRINGGDLAKALGTSINCSPLLPNNQAAASAARAR
ncbi:MAG: hypothetical protein HYX67_07655 [Candidatus Melainabacteria bacterium]|nr:hypothetical protein [Candidatus Melainabacteria bacterium]